MQARVIDMPPRRRSGLGQSEVSPLPQGHTVKSDKCIIVETGSQHLSTMKQVSFMLLAAPQQTSLPSYHVP